MSNNLFKNEPENEEVEIEKSLQTVPFKENTFYLKQEDETKDPERLTWQKIVKFNLKYKYWVLAVSLICMILGFIGFKYILNPRKETFMSRFSLSLPYIDEENKTLITNLQFDYRNLISKDKFVTLSEYKNASGKTFDGLSIYENSNINIRELTLEEKETYGVDYELTGSVKEIGTNNLNAFIESIIKIDQQLLKTSVAQMFDLNNFKNSTSTNYTEDLTKLFTLHLNLNRMVNYTENTFGRYAVISDDNLKFDDFLSGSDGYEASFTQSTNKYLNPTTLKFEDVKLERLGQIDDNSSAVQVLDLLNKLFIGTVTPSTNPDQENFVPTLQQAETFGYVPKSITDDPNKVNTFVNDVQARLNLISADYESNKSQLEYYSNALKNQSSNGAMDVTTIIDKITDLNESINGEKEMMKYYNALIINAKRDFTTTGNENYIANRDSFETQFLQTKDLLVKFAQEYVNAFNYIVNNNMLVKLGGTSLYTVDGGLSPYIGLAGGLVGGFILSAAVVCLICQFKQKEKAEKKPDVIAIEEVTPSDK